MSLRLSSFRKIEIFALWYDLVVAWPMRSHRLTIILHSAVKFAAVKWTLLTASFVKQMATLCFGKKFVVRTVKELLPSFLKPIRKAMLLHRQMMGAYGQFQSAKLWTGSAMLNCQGCYPEQAALTSRTEVLVAGFVEQCRLSRERASPCT